MNTLLSVALSTKALISAFVWSAVAFASIASNFVLSPFAKAPSEGCTCKVEIVTPFTPAKSVNSLSIKAPAEVTFAVSVTSAFASIPDNLFKSVVDTLLVVIPPPPVETNTLLAVCPVMETLFVVKASNSASNEAYPFADETLLADILPLEKSKLLIVLL